MKKDEFYSNSLNAGTDFLLAETTAADFIFSSDLKFISRCGVGALFFRSAASDPFSDCYRLSVNIDKKQCSFSRWTNNIELPLSREMDAPESRNGYYNLKVVALNNWISCYVNDVLVASSGDYVLAPLELGQKTILKDGFRGYLSMNGEVTFQNVFCTPIDAANDPTLLDITVSSQTGPVETRGQFDCNAPISMWCVGNAATLVDITPHPINPAAEITVTGPDGIVYKDGKEIPVNVGKNIITVESKMKGDASHHTSLLYRVNVHRRQNETIYYNEPFRDQYHYSVKDGWGNDPNGLIFYKGTYHVFYQFFDDQVWGPMHWAHATSRDLLHWEEQPVAFFPDGNGTMFSGCIVADEKNTSGLFSTEEGGLVAFITCNGNGQRLKIASSEDEGRTWKKRDEIVADWTEDPLQVIDFRDPKVFCWENKWFMIIAGGPIRIYSSDNLINWTCEFTWLELHSECPDLIPLQTREGTLKWVLSRGGRFYKIGDFTNADGSWKFVPDKVYEYEDGVINFGKDSYAAMSFYKQDFGTAEHPTLPEICVLNWMNTWDDYCTKVAVTLGQAFNGTYNLVLKLGLENANDRYVLTQTPIDAYRSLRGEAAIQLKGAELTQENDLLNTFKGDCYEIVSTFYPAGNTTKVGFKLRTGKNEFTEISYDCQEQEISIDRSHSGVIISGRFLGRDSQKVAPNPDGSISMHIFADRASVEVFTGENRVCGANQIFPSVDSLGVQVFSEGENALADVSIYPMNSVWEKSDSECPVAMQRAAAEETLLYVGDSAVLRAVLLPIRAAQEIQWSVADETVVKLTGCDGMRATITGLKLGETVVTARAVADPGLSASYTVKLFENHFETNAGEFLSAAGNWIVDDKILRVSNVGANNFYMTREPLDKSVYTLETKVKITKGIVNFFLASKNVYPFEENAYSVQLAGNRTGIRIFRFGAGTICEADMGRRLDDGEYHAFKFSKGADSIAVSIDGVDVIETKLEKTEEFFNRDPHIGIGIFDGTMEVQTLYVK